MSVFFKYNMLLLLSYFIISLFLTLLKPFLTIFILSFFFILITGVCLFSFLTNFNLFVFQQKVLNFQWSFIEVLLFNNELSLNFRIDILSFFFILLVLIIGFSTNIYVLNYFKYEPFGDSFYILLNWFIISMIIVVSANNAFTLYLGWELIGLTSYFLINFWSDRIGTFKSSFKALTFNKFSDCCLLTFFVVILNTFSTTNFHYINTIVSSNIIKSNIELFYGVCFLLIAASIKSAQLFGHLWLPDSMEAPVPASALIHSATLVSAGIYLLLRFNVILNLTSVINIVLFLGAITAAYGGFVAAAQTDVKKLLAYSTISHCGFLFVCVGLQEFYLTVTYLYIHGIFKALTFFCVGSLIRVAGSQDTRYMGALSRVMPADSILLIICSTNLGGLPFTLGYLYKDLFITAVSLSEVNVFIVSLCFIGLWSSLVYIYRLVYYSLFDFHKSSSYYLSLSLQEIRSTKDYMSLSTFAHFFSIFIALFIFLYLYLTFFITFSDTCLVIEQTPIILSSNTLNTLDSKNFYKIYYYIFYLVFIFISFIILFYTNRKSFTGNYKWCFICFITSLCYILMLFNHFNMLKKFFYIRAYVRKVFKKNPWYIYLIIFLLYINIVFFWIYMESFVDIYKWFFINFIILLFFFTLKYFFDVVKYYKKKYSHTIEYYINKIFFLDLIYTYITTFELLFYIILFCGENDAYKSSLKWHLICVAVLFFHEVSLLYLKYMYHIGFVVVMANLMVL